jgi:TP901 family phage tail tape measure protein
MANIEKTVKIIFGGEDTGLRLTTSSVAKNLNDLDGQIGKMAQPLANFSDNILKIDAVLAALAVGAIALAINKAGEFGGSFKEISTLIDASSTDIANFRTEVLAYAQSSGKSIADINQAIYKAVSAGIDYKVVLAELSTAEKLSIAGRNDLASTTVLLAGTMNAYGAKASEAGHYSDVFMETVRKGLTTLPELAGSLANVTGIASMGKVPIETLSAAIAALTATGIPTEQAITGMKNVIANIIKPTAEAKAEAEKLGIQFNATALQTKGLETVLWDAWRATGGNAEAMNTLFGSIRGLNAATVLASDSSGRFKDILQDMSTVAGTTETAYAKMAGGFSEVNQNIKNNIDVLLIDVGQRLMPEYGKIAGSLSDVMKGVKIGLDAGAFDPLFAELDKYGSQIAETLKTIAKNLPEAMKGLDFSGLI